MAGSKLGMRPTTDKNFYLRLTVEKMHAFAVFTKKYLRPYDCSDTSCTTAVNCTKPKTEMQTKIIKIQIILRQF